VTLQPRHPDENLLRQLAPQVLGVVSRRFRNFPAAEDAVQEALLAAATQWPNEGVPDNPRGWLIQVACRRMSDYLRSDFARRRREADQAIQASLDEEAPTWGASDETNQIELCPARALPHLQRGLRQQHRPRPATQRSLE
jgi:predicted RNA polymerase sigma factor